MRESSLGRDPESGRLLVRLTGFFDRESALDLREELQRTHGDLILDFSGVEDFDDLGVATLARVLIETPDRRIGVRGLRQHQLRLFRYVGVRLDGLASAAEPGPGPLPRS